jgi:hypothetical protein
MNYTLDNQLTKQLARSALAHRGKGKVYLGLGLYLMKDAASTFIEQCEALANLSVDGVVVFSYDDIDDESIKTLRSL